MLWVAQDCFRSPYTMFNSVGKMAFCDPHRHCNPCSTKKLRCYLPPSNKIGYCKGPRMRSENRRKNRSRRAGLPRL